MIILSGNLFLLFLGTAIRAAKEPAGTHAWWEAVLAATFDPKGIGTITWSLLAGFLLGNVLNVIGLWPEIQRSRYSIQGLMVAVVIVAVTCACLRYWPLVGLILILMASLSPAMVFKFARRSRPGDFNRGPTRAVEEASPLIRSD